MSTLKLKYRKYLGKHYYYPDPDCPISRALRSLTRRTTSLTKGDLTTLSRLLELLGVDLSIELTPADPVTPFHPVTIEEDAYEF